MRYRIRVRAHCSGNSYKPLTVFDERKIPTDRSAIVVLEITALHAIDNEIERGCFSIRILQQQ